METKDILKWWGIPKVTVINKNLPKTQILPHMKSAKEKKFLIDSVQSIYMLANFKTDNTNIPAFESVEELYKEVWFYYVSTKENGGSEKIFKMLADLIPYPLVVLTEESETFTIYTGRFERKANNYLTLKNIYPSPVYNNEKAELALKKLVISELPRQNFKVFYDGLRDGLAKQLAVEQYGEETSDITADVKDQLDEISKKIEYLRGKINKEKQLNQKIDMQMNLKKLKDELQDIIKH